jgi:glycosyltransferase involved in cell wall biosynthesis
MCEAFAALDFEVVLYYIPSSSLNEDIHTYFDIEKDFSFKSLPRAILPFRKNFKLNKWSSLPLFAHAFLWSGLVAYLSRQERPLFYFVREPLLAWWLGKKNLPVVLELHDMPSGNEKSFVRWASHCWSVKMVVTVTEHLRNDLINYIGVPAEKTQTLHDGVDSRRLFLDLTKTHARDQVGLTSDRPLIVYTGQLRPEKGVEVLVRAAAMLKDAEVLIVGGAASDCERLQQLISKVESANTRMVGFVPPSDTALYLKAANILVLPHSAKFAHSAYYTSPLKLFEYMAAGVPIVASSLPSVREILRHGENAWLVQPDDSLALARGIQWLLKKRSLGEELAAQAAKDVQAYTWERRAAHILRTWQARS